MTSLAVVGFTGIDSVTTHKIRGRLKEKEIRFSVVKNSLARQAFEAIGMPEAKDLLDGPCAVAYGEDPLKTSVVSVVRELLDIAKGSPNLKVKAAVLEGDIFEENRIKELSLYPTRDEAISKAVQCILSPGANLAGCLIGPGGKIASILKSIQEKKESEGDAA
jgi:ribosomal protein L10